MDWYRKFPGDYGRDTAALSLVEHGVYNVLLDLQYATEAGLPAELRELYFVCRSTSKREQNAVKIVAEKHFPISADGLRWNPRAAAEIAKYKAVQHQWIESGKRGAAKRWGDRVPHSQPHHETVGYPIDSASGTPSESVGYPNRVAIAFQNPDTRINLKRGNSPPTLELDSPLRTPRQRESAHPRRAVMAPIEKLKSRKGKDPPAAPAPQNLAESARKLAAVGNQVGDIVRLLAAYEVTAEQVQQWLA
jgi:uncharacterized protein YdaU (DUF1376 family)